MLVKIIVSWCFDQSCRYKYVFVAVQSAFKILWDVSNWNPVLINEKHLGVEMLTSNGTVLHEGGGC